MVRIWPLYSLCGLHIRIPWFSWYGIRIPLFSLYGSRIPLFSLYGNAAQIFGCKGHFLDTALLWAANDAALSQGPLLWCHIDIDVLWNMHRPEQEPRHGNHGLSIDDLFVGFHSDLLHISVKYSMYITGHNRRLVTVLGVFNKCSGLWPSDTISSWWLGWHRYACTGKKVFVKLYDLSFQSVTLVVLIHMFVLDKRNTSRLRDTVRPTSPRKSVAGAGPAAADFSRDVCLSVLHNHKVFLLYHPCKWDMWRLLHASYK